VARERVEVLCRNRAGRPHPQLRPLIDALDTEHRPREIIAWLHNARWAQVIKTVASQHDQITHGAFDETPGSQQVAHARAAMVHLGILDARDEEIDGTIPWLEQFLETQPPAIATVIRPYAMWSVLRRARNRVPQENRAARKYARSRIVLATKFLVWLDQRGQALIGATQRDVDVWLVADTANRHRLRDFLVWAHARRMCAALEVPWQQRGEPELYLDEDQRRALLRACLQREDHPLDLRASATLILLFGLTPTRIVQIQRDHLTTWDSRTYLTIGRRPMVLPRTVADLLSALAQQAPTGHHSILVTPGDGARWLVPGSKPGAHAAASHLSTRLNRHLGLRVRNARNAAISALALDLPAPVLADLLGIEIGTAIRWTKLVKARLDCIRRQ